MEQETDEGQEMEPRQGRCQPFIVTRQAPKARRPGEAALHSPPHWQRHEAPCGLGQLDHPQLDPGRGGQLRDLRPEPLAEVDAWLGRYRTLWQQRLDALHTEVARGKRERRSTR